jgi:hypothetical protein
LRTDFPIGFLLTLRSLFPWIIRAKRVSAPPDGYQELRTRTEEKENNEQLAR